ncbi:class A beta-lactamase [Alsobacter sp. KACC 23698]|uniref:class A beta-lactamase n=1 Tax=Alsobacter sp. KACC 23698 TaxID=3149229 RepID=UPI003877E2F9
MKARVGVMVSEVGTDRRWAYRQDERFPMASTFKAFACAALLARVDAGERRLDDRVAVRSSDLVSYAPVTEKHVGGTMSLAEICAAATGVSDNTAANLILDAIGGPAGLTAFMRKIGDADTRLDRRETELNEGTPGDLRDTTTPAAAAESFRKLVLGDVLSAGSRRQLQEWLVANQVAGPLLRASLPQGWRIADRSGAGGHGTRNVLAVLWPPRGLPIVSAIYLSETDASMDARNAAIAEIGRAMIRVVGS